MQQHPADCLRGPVRRSRGPRSRPPKPGDPNIRWDLVERIRKEIAEGTYETQEKLEKALDRLLGEME